MGKKLTFVAYAQFPKPRRIGLGTLAVSEGGRDAIFVTEDGKVARLERVRLESAGSMAIKLSGMEETGTAKDGRKVYGYQEWVLVME